jgi:hypothetical protein
MSLNAGYMDSVIVASPIMIYLSSTLRIERAEIMIHILRPVDAKPSSQIPNREPFYRIVGKKVKVAARS